MQAKAYIASQNGSVSSDALYIIYIGANDYLAALRNGHDSTTTVQRVLGYTADAMALLYKAGARV